ncbi:helix-turn-helix domain-containing protein [Microcoleus sp.]|uniref:helix-turn-helix domain-containing protein n=1 Tax=Microcoleus sp. TaxID=44472 RepID=UPI0035932F9A
MLLSFKTELKPNNRQVTLFRQHCGVARHTTLVMPLFRKFCNSEKQTRQLKFPLLLTCINA